MERATIHVDGVVQSVGFRPFVYRTATELGLHGTVRNLGDAGVRIELEGEAGDVDSFLARLREESPPLASVETVAVDREAVASLTFDSFEILESAHDGSVGAGTIPPDTAMCDACLSDVRDPDSRFSDYWATACVDCGPRFTVVESLPYDRPATSMAAFSMCEACRAEYEDPTDRRYHAQAIACPRCGPTLAFGTVGDEALGQVDAPDEARDAVPDPLSIAAQGREAVTETARTIGGGDLAVVKGVGGAHLACDATDADAVERLRERTGRPAKPFAVMVADADDAAAIARLSSTERTALTSPRRPILLLDERRESAVASGVAPGLHTLGVMLPYSGVHHLLFDHLDGPIVLTSANLPGKPMLVDNRSIVAGLGDVAEGFLLHDRRIVARCDDSVARVVDGQRRLLRRSRGFAPTPVDLSIPGEVLALGPELDVAPAVLADGDCYLTQYVGDVDDVATLKYHGEAIEHLLSITGLAQPPVVAHDAHPEFHTTDRARELEREAGLERVAVQHHHAHAASVLAEHDREAAVALTVDGVGYGPDGTVWGGEVLDATPAAYERVGGLAPMAMPGGDRATRFPGRMLAGGFFAHPDYDVDRVREVLRSHEVPFPSDDERDLVCQQLTAGVNTPETTSGGRFLDAVSALLSASGERTYEGEPAMSLEALAAAGTPADIEPPRTQVDGRPAVDTPSVLVELADRREAGLSLEDAAATAQEVLARGLAGVAVEVATERDRGAIALSGGVAYNEHVATRVREVVEGAGFEFLANEQVPPGDGGVAYGQAAVAAARTDDSS